MTCTKTTHTVCKRMRDEISYVANRMYFLVDRIASDSLRSNFKDYIRRLNDLVENISLIPRNCDLYEIEDEAYKAWKKEMEYTPEKAYLDYEDWLFAEAKGEAK